MCTTQYIMCIVHNVIQHTSYYKRAYTTQPPQTTYCKSNKCETYSAFLGYSVKSMEVTSLCFTDSPEIATCRCLAAALGGALLAATSVLCPSSGSSKQKYVFITDLSKKIKQIIKFLVQHIQYREKNIGTHFIKC